MEVILRRVPVLLLIWLLASTIGISAQQQNTPQQTPEKPAWAWDWHKAFAPESLSNWVLMLVGIGGTLAALRTLKTINRQTTFLRQSAQATENAVQATLRNTEVLVNGSSI